MANYITHKDGNVSITYNDELLSVDQQTFKEEWLICNHCGNALPKEDAIETEDGHFFCDEDCAKEGGYSQCQNCEGWYPANSMLNISGQCFCDEECVHNYGYYRCARCEDWVHEDDAVYIDDLLFCHSACAEEAGYCQCDHCDEWYDRDDMIYTSDTDEWYCKSCAEDNLYRCEECGEWFVYEDSMSEDDHGVCTSCDENRSHIRSYHTSKNRGKYSFLRTPADEQRGAVPFLGFELEVEGGEDRCELASNINSLSPNTFFFERDGSLSSEGVEIISQPASILWHIEHRSLYQNIRKECLSLSFTSHNNGDCGLHIHVDKDFFEDHLDVATAKLLFLVERHWDNLVKFSRRTREQIERWCDRYLLPGRSETLSQIAKKRTAQTSRYYAINLTNSHTIEFRLWRGTLRVQTFMATLKLTARLCELAKTKTAVELAKMSWMDILGTDEDILGYWATRVPTEEEDTNPYADSEDGDDEFSAENTL